MIGKMVSPCWQHSSQYLIQIISLLSVSFNIVHNKLKLNIKIEQKSILDFNTGYKYGQFHTNHTNTNVKPTKAGLYWLWPSFKSAPTYIVF